MAKDFLGWHRIKSGLEATERRLLSKEREIWWCSVGLNIGSEEDGKGKLFHRPVLIVRRFDARTFWGLPLSSSIKSGSYYHELNFGGTPRSVLLLQLRIFDAKRLARRMGKIGNTDFAAIKNGSPTSWEKRSPSCWGGAPRGPMANVVTV